MVPPVGGATLLLVTLQFNVVVKAVFAVLGATPAKVKTIVEAHGTGLTTKAPPPPACAGSGAAQALICVLISCVVPLILSVQLNPVLPSCDVILKRHCEAGGLTWPSVT